MGANAQSCVTQDDVKQMLARNQAPPPAKPDKKLQKELLDMFIKQRDLLLQVVERDQKKESDTEKLRKVYDTNTTKLCQILKTVGWPTTELVERDGVFSAFQIPKNAGTYELQRDLLPVIVAVIKKDLSRKPEFAGLYDRLAVSAGKKQVFGSGARLIYSLRRAAGRFTRLENYPISTACTSK